jgi:hypothetical protein
MIHDKEGLRPNVFELEVQLRGLVEGIAGDADRARLKNAKKDGRIMGEIGQEDANPVTRLYTPGDEEICHPLSGFFNLSKSACCAFKDGVSMVRIELCRRV